jgi:hypothetical protein
LYGESIDRRTQKAGVWTTHAIALVERTQRERARNPATPRRWLLFLVRLPIMAWQRPP